MEWFKVGKMRTEKSCVVLIWSIRCQNGFVYFTNVLNNIDEGFSGEIHRKIRCGQGSEVVEKAHSCILLNGESRRSFEKMEHSATGDAGLAFSPRELV